MTGLSYIFAKDLASLLGEIRYTTITEPMLKYFVSRLEAKGQQQRKLSVARYLCSFASGMASMSKYYGNDWFFASRAKIAEFCMMTEDEIRAAVDFFVEAGVLEKRHEGVGKKIANEYRMKYTLLLTLITKWAKANLQSNSEKKILHDVAKKNKLNSNADNKKMQADFVGAQPTYTGDENLVLGAQPAPLNKHSIYKQLSNNHINQETRLQSADCNIAAASSSGQRSLFSMPARNPYTGTKAQAWASITTARKTGDWSKVTPTHLAYYFIIQHKNILGRDTLYNSMMVGVNAKTFSDCVISKFNLSVNNIPDFVDRLLAWYKQNPPADERYRNLVTMNAIATVLERRAMMIAVQVENENPSQEVKDENYYKWGKGRQERIAAARAELARIEREKEEAESRNSAQ